MYKGVTAYTHILPKETQETQREIPFLEAMSRQESDSCLDKGAAHPQPSGYVTAVKLTPC